MEHNPLDEIKRILEQMSQDEQQKEELKSPAEFVLPKTVDAMADWSTQKLIEKEKPTPLSKEEQEKLTLQANIQLGSISKRLSSLNALLKDSPFAFFIGDTLEELTNQVKDLDEILNTPIDYEKLSEQGKHEFQHFLMKREQLLTNFKKQV